MSLLPVPQFIPPPPFPPPPFPGTPGQVVSAIGGVMQTAEGAVVNAVNQALATVTGPTASTITDSRGQTAVVNVQDPAFESFARHVGAAIERLAAEIAAIKGRMGVQGYQPYAAPSFGGSFGGSSIDPLMLVLLLGNGSVDTETLILLMVAGAFSGGGSGSIDPLMLVLLLQQQQDD